MCLKYIMLTLLFAGLHIASANTTTITDIEDAYISSQTPYTNYNSQLSLNIGNDNPLGVNMDLYAYLKFATPIPNGTYKLFLYQKPLSSSVPLNITVKRVTSNWSASIIIWNSKPSNDNYVWASNVISNDSVGYYEWDITSLVNYWQNNPHENYGILLSSPDYNYSDKYFGRSIGNINEAPKLVITHSFWGSTITYTPSVGTISGKVTSSNTTPIIITSAIGIGAIMIAITPRNKLKKILGLK